MPIAQGLRVAVARRAFAVGHRLFYGTPVQRWRVTEMLRGRTVDRMRGTEDDVTVQVCGLTLVCPAADDSIAASLLTGQYEPLGRRALEAVIQPGMTVVDVGANVGIYTLTAAARVGLDGHVYAVEPNPTTQALLLANVERNNLTNVTVVPCAAGETAGTAVLHVKLSELGTASLVHGEGVGTDVRVARLDAELAGIVPDVIKVDVEGFELPALLGMAGLLDAADPVLLVEHNPGDQAAELRTWIAARYSHVWSLDERRGQVRRLSREQLRAFDSYGNLLAANSDLGIG